MKLARVVCSNRHQRLLSECRFAASQRRALAPRSTFLRLPPASANRELVESLILLVDHKGIIIAQTTPTTIWVAIRGDADVIVVFRAAVTVVTAVVSFRVAVAAAAVGGCVGQTGSFEQTQKEVGLVSQSKQVPARALGVRMVDVVSFVSSCGENFAAYQY